MCVLVGGSVCSQRAYLNDLIVAVLCVCFVFVCVHALCACVCVCLTEMEKYIDMWNCMEIIIYQYAEL